MNYSNEVERMCTVAKGPHHGPAPIPEEGKWVKAYEIKDISGFTHGVGWCAPQQGACKLSLNIKNGIIEEALVEDALGAKIRDILVLKVQVFDIFDQLLQSCGDREAALVGHAAEEHVEVDVALKEAALEVAV